MITAGVDLAAMPERTALASIEWERTRAVIRDLVCPAGDDVILEAIERAGKTGIDCPLGWPDAFVDFVAAHIAALTARAASRGQTCPPGVGDLATATAEGWIAIPNAPISRLI